MRDRSDLAGEGVGGGFPPSHHGREIFGNFMYENVIIRGSLCSGINRFPSIFPFFFSFLFTRRSTGGMGPPCAPLSYAYSYTSGLRHLED